MKIHNNVHERRFKVPSSEVGRLIDALGSIDDCLWPRRDWPPMLFDERLGVGSVGGHGPIHYRCTAYQPGRHVVFEFISEGLLHGLCGQRSYEVFREGDATTILRHTLQAHVGITAFCRWTMVLRPLHDALIEDSLDQAERELLGNIANPREWNGKVRLLPKLVRAYSHLLTTEKGEPRATQGTVRSK